MSWRAGQRQGATGLRADTTLLAWSLAALALMLALRNPVVGINQSMHRHLLVFDITQSMNAIDEGQDAVPESRLDRSRHAALEAMLAMRCGSEVGLGLFTGHRTLVLFEPVEVCAHFSDISATIRAIDWRMAWEARSEVAKGLHSALIAARLLPRETSVVFVTDGHEAPPLNPSLPPRYRGTPGDVAGVLAGVGGAVKVPIPKFDAEGRQRGNWKHSDVLQVDPGSLGRVGSSVSGDSVGGGNRQELLQRIAAGTEHLTSLRQDYLRDLSAGLKLSYIDANTVAGMRRALEYPRLAIQRVADFELRTPLAAVALALLIVSTFSGRARR